MLDSTSTTTTTTPSLDDNTPKDEEKGVVAPSPESSTTDPVLPPEGGLRGWLCCAGGCLGFFSTLGFLNAIGVFQSTYQTTLLKNYTASDISWIFTVQLSLIWAPGPLYGRIVDTYGARPVMIPCTILCIFSLCMTSLSTEYYQIFLAQGIGYGIGAGGVFTTCFVCVGQWFVKQRGLALGITVAGSSIGGVIFPFFLQRVMEDIGFDAMVRYTALFMGITLVGACILLEARLPPKKWNPDLKWVDLTLFKDRGFAFYAVGSYFVMWGLWAPFDFLPSMAQLSGTSDSMALYLISILNASSLFGRVIPGHIGDKVGYFNVIVVSAFLSCLSILCLWLPFDYYSSNAGLIVFSVAYGFSSGAFVSIMMPCCAKSGSLETLGVQLGTYQAVIAVSTLTGLPIMGAIFGKQNDSTYMGMQVFAIASLFVGSLCLLTSRNVLAAKHGTWKY